MSCPIYFEEVRERSRIAHSARNKKGKGGRAINARLPSDNMTKTEIKKKNGPVESYSLGRPMSWDQFKALPDDSLKKEYLSKLVSKHGGTSAGIARMFDITDVTVRRYGRTLGIQFPKGRTKEQIAAWDKFLNAATHNALFDVPAAEDTDEVLEQVPAIPQNGQADNSDKQNIQPSLEPPVWEAPAEDSQPECAAATLPAVQPSSIAIPSGTVTFRGPASECLERIAAMLGSMSCTITVQWTTEA